MEQEIDIPDNALTTCPDRRYALVSIAKKCMVCPYSQGLAQVSDVVDETFPRKYRVLCGVPQQREIVMFEGDE